MNENFLAEDFLESSLFVALFAEVTELYFLESYLPTEVVWFNLGILEMNLEGGCSSTLIKLNLIESFVSSTNYYVCVSPADFLCFLKV